MNNPNNPRGQTPDDQMKNDRMKKQGGKPMDDKTGQKARPKDGKDDLSDGLDKNKSNDMNKGQKPDQGQMDQGRRQH